MPRRKKTLAQKRNSLIEGYVEKRATGKPLSARYMKGYIGRNIVRLSRKMKNAKKSGWYMGSEAMKSASSTMRYLYRKYDFDPDQMHTGESFMSHLQSWNEIRAFYNALKKIEEASPAASRIRLKAKEREFKQMMEESKQKAIQEGRKVLPKAFNTSYKDRFQLLSDLSSEFHEIFAFMTYNEVESTIAEGNNTIELLLSAYYNKISDYDWTNEEKRERYKNKITIRTHEYLTKKYTATGQKNQINKKFKKITKGL